MPDRYFSESPIALGSLTLSGPEAHHLLHVMRVKVGEAITVFDGGGSEFSAHVTTLQRSAVVCEVTARHDVDRELARPITVGVALPKGDRQKWLIEKLVELGVRQVVPLSTTRGVAQPADQTLAKLNRAVIEAAKQCGRNRLLQVAAPQSLADFVQQAQADSLRLIAHPAGEQITLQPPDLSTHLAQTEGGISLAIGPEGGFTDTELTLATAAGWQSIALGPRILRVETAAAFLVAAITSRMAL